MNIPDRSRHDPEIAESLSILGAAGNAALIERNHVLSEENESLLDGAAKRQAHVEELEARVVALESALHTQAQGHAAGIKVLTDELNATRDRELALLNRGQR